MIIDLVAAYQMDKLTLAFNYDYWGSQGRVTAAPGSHAKLTGFALYGKYQFTDVLAEALRFEYFSDVNGLGGLGFGPAAAGDTGTGSRVFELTLTTEVKVANQLILRFELRSDNSNNHNMSRDG